jgi:hypothetical protein
MSFWLTAANSWAGALRGFWTAEMHCQQTAMANEMMRQAIKSWTTPIAGHKAKGRR